MPLPQGRHTAACQRVKAARQFLGWSPAKSQLENYAILGVGRPPVLKRDGRPCGIHLEDDCASQPASQPASQLAS